MVRMAGRTDGHACVNLLYVSQFLKAEKFYVFMHDDRN